MCGYFSTRFINFMVKGRRLLDYINSFSPNKYEKNDKIICFRNQRFILWIDSKTVRIKKVFCINCNKYRQFKNPKI